jgi:hypothetical protein
MNKSNLQNKKIVKEDTLISVCFSNLVYHKECFIELIRTADNLKKLFKFFEIIVIVNSSEENTFDNLKNKICNLRILSIQKNTSEYYRRYVLAKESIGDIVVITNTEESKKLFLNKMIFKSIQENKSVTAYGKYSKSFTKEFLNKFILALGKISGFRVDVNSFSTMILHRHTINLLENYSDPILSFRFLPIHPSIANPFVFYPKKFSTTTFRYLIRERSIIIYRLFINLSPALLNIVALFSFFLFLIGIVYFFYVLIIWLTVKEIEPGWTTISIMLASTSIFLGSAITGLSLGLQYILNVVKSPISESSIKEINQIDSFSSIQKKLNVEYNINNLPKNRKLKKSNGKNK